MRIVISALALALAFSFSAAQADACGAKKKDETVSAEKEAPKAAQVATASFAVKMKCGNCGDRIKTALIDSDGVYKVEIHVKDNRVVVKYDSKKLSPKKIAKLIADKTGYAAEAEV